VRSVMRREARFWTSWRHESLAIVHHGENAHNYMNIFIICNYRRLLLCLYDAANEEES
jgi:hypothetical protein